jgi:hypothetical protein
MRRPGDTRLGGLQSLSREQAATGGLLLEQTQTHGKCTKPRQDYQQKDCNDQRNAALPMAKSYIAVHGTLST